MARRDGAAVVRAAEAVVEEAWAADLPDRSLSYFWLLVAIGWAAGFIAEAAVLLFLTGRL